MGAGEQGAQRLFSGNTFKLGFPGSPGNLGEGVGLVISGQEGKGQGAQTSPPHSLSLPLAAEFTGPPQKPPRLGAQVCVGGAEAGNDFEPGLPKTQGQGL